MQRCMYVPFALGEIGCVLGEVTVESRTQQHCLCSPFTQSGADSLVPSVCQGNSVTQVSTAKKKKNKIRTKTVLIK